MSAFDAKHGINKRRKTRFVAIMMFSFAAGILFALAAMLANKDQIPNIWSIALLLMLGGFGAGAGLFYCAYKILSWLDRPHAVAALRSVMLSPDPYND